MVSRPVIGIITLFLFAAFALPAFVPFFPKDIIPDNRFISLLLVVRIFLAVLPAYLGLSGIPTNRGSMGWKHLGKHEILLALILTIITLGLGIFFTTGATEEMIKSSVPAELILLAALAVVSAISEEIFFRSWLNGALPFLGLNPRICAVLSVALFAFIHIGNGFPTVLFAFLAGSLYTAVYLFEKNLWTVLIAHILHNSLAFLFHAFG